MTNFDEFFIQSDFLTKKTTTNKQTGFVLIDKLSAKRNSIVMVLFRTYKLCDNSEIKGLHKIELYALNSFIIGKSAIHCAVQMPQKCG